MCFLSHRHHMSLGAEEKCAARNRRRSHANFAHLICRQHAKLRTWFHHKNRSFFTSKVELALGSHRGSSESLPAATQTLLVLFPSRAGFIARENAVNIATV